MLEVCNGLSEFSGAMASRCAGRAVYLAGVTTFLALTAAFSPGAAAAVLEIEPDGSVSVYDAPSVVTAEGTRPIVQPSAASHGAASPDMRRLLTVAADRYTLNRELLNAVAWRESHFRADAVSTKGAVGPMQLMAGTARDLGVNRYDLSQNILGGAAYLRRMIDHFHGNISLALAAYNAGPGAVERNRGIPPFAETQHYVGAVLGQIGQAIPTSSLIVNH